MTVSSYGWIGCAVPIFWGVGAYNRLVRLRAAINLSFAAVDVQLQHRHGLLLRWADAVAPAFATDAAPVDMLRAACMQAVAACDHARQRPGASRPMASFQVAERVLVQARQRADAAYAQRAVATTTLAAAASATAAADDQGASAEVADAAAFAGLCHDIARLDGAFSHARAQFNASVAAYNHAVRQFPTVLLARVFGFRRAGLL